MEVSREEILHIAKLADLNINPLAIAEILGNVINPAICLNPFTLIAVVINTVFTIAPTTYCEFAEIQLVFPNKALSNCGIIIGTKKINILNIIHCIISNFFVNGRTTSFKQLFSSIITSHFFINFYHTKYIKVEINCQCLFFSI